MTRLVSKAGESNVNNGKAAKKGAFVGLFTFLVDAQWRWTGLVFFASFYVTWTFFAIVFWIICYLHGDLDRSQCTLSFTQSCFKCFYRCRFTRSHEC